MMCSTYFCVYTRKREDICFLVNGEKQSLHETCTRMKALIDGRTLCAYGTPDKNRVLSLFSLAGQQTTAKFVDFFKMVADKIIVGSVIGGFPRIIDGMPNLRLFTLAYFLLDEDSSPGLDLVSAPAELIRQGKKCVFDTRQLARLHAVIKSAL